MYTILYIPVDYLAELSVFQLMAELPAELLAELPAEIPAELPASQLSAELAGLSPFFILVILGMIFLFPARRLD